MSGKPSNIATIILAAGKSARMGTPKQMLPYRGTTLLNYLISVAQGITKTKILVITGAFRMQVESSIVYLPVEVHYNAHWKAGMGSSLSAGIRHANFIWPDLEYLLIMLCDQPLVDATVLKKLIQQQQKTAKSIVASEYANTIGPPLLIHKRLFCDFEKISGESGAKKIILQHPDQLSTISFENGEWDVDTPEDWNNLLANYSG